MRFALSLPHSLGMLLALYIALASAVGAQAQHSVEMLESDQIPILEWSFSPADMTVAVGDTVFWTNTGTLAHTVTADDRSLDSGLVQPGESYGLTFSSLGVFTYFCVPHPWMRGTIIVAEAMSDPAEAASPSGLRL